jgi:hypothetical protein
MSIRFSAAIMRTCYGRNNPANTRLSKPTACNPIVIDSRLCADKRKRGSILGVAVVKSLLFRFLVGGLFVSAFAALGNILKPKSFAGLFGAAPSIALATLGLTIATEGSRYAALEARSMIAGAIAFLGYAWCVMQFMFRLKPAAMLLTSTLLLVWLAAALGIWFLLLR